MHHQLNESCVEVLLSVPDGREEGEEGGVKVYRGLAQRHSLGRVLQRTQCTPQGFRGLRASIAFNFGVSIVWHLSCTNTP